MIRVIAAGSLALMMVLQFANAADREDRHKIPTDAKAMLENADSFELFALDPDQKADPQESFHDWKVVAKRTIDNAEVRKRLVEKFEEGVAEYKGDAHRCFIPHHGIRVKHAGKSADFVICFACSRVEVFVDGQNVSVFVVSDEPAELFHQTLKDAGVEFPAAKTDSN